MPERDRSRSEETSAYRGRISVNIPTPVVPPQNLPRVRSFTGTSQTGGDASPGKPRSPVSSLNNGPRTGSVSAVPAPVVDDKKPDTHRTSDVLRTNNRLDSNKDLALHLHLTKPQKAQWPFEDVLGAMFHSLSRTEVGDNEDYVVSRPWYIQYPRAIVLYIWHLIVSRFFLTLLWALTCVYFDCVMQVLAQSIALATEDIELAKLRAATNSSISQVEFDTLRILPDVGYSIFPDLSSWGSTPAVRYVTVFAIITLIRFLATPMRQTIFRRVLAIYGTLFVVRGASILITLYPNPFPGCRSTIDVSKPFSEAFYIMGQAKYTCYDVLFSGHTITLTICGLLWHTYSHVVPLMTTDILAPARCNRPFLSSDGQVIQLTFVKLAVWVAASVGYFLIISTHFHYSADVVVGIVITVFAWQSYHQFILTCVKRDTPFTMIVKWFEDYKEGEVHVETYRFNSQSLRNPINKV